MPCYDSRRDEHPSGEGWSARAERLEKRNNELARLLCEASNKLAQTGHLYEMSRELQAWYKEHKAFDKKRGAKK